MEREYIARISYGKDSLKMLDVIWSRGLPLDRITTTDVWATDTISANLPPVHEFKERMDQKIWDMYRIEVEHLCARNKDGTKRTYEQMFYHVPVRRSQIGQVERETDSGPARSLDSRICGTRGVKLDSNGMPMHRVQGNITGFPPNTRYNWCQKLKIVGGAERDPGVPFPRKTLVQRRPQNSCADPKGSLLRYPHGAESSKSTRSRHLFGRARNRNAQRQKYCGVPRNSSG